MLCDPEQNTRPLLTIAIPTFNRADELRELLGVLQPQLVPFPQIEVVVSDNASADETPEVLAEAQERFTAQGIRFRSHRHGENIGSDANFAFCYTQARGHFFWMCGDDDIIVPGALASVVPHLQDVYGQPAAVDLLYMTSYGFREDWRAERAGDPLHRQFHTFKSARTFAKVVNIMFTFISGMIVNKSRLEELAPEAPAAFVGTNLVQLSWSLPLLPHFRRGIAIWDRPVAARQGRAHGYSLGRVFGERLASTVERLLPGRKDLSAPILDFALRRWFPSVLLDIRADRNTTLQLEEAHPVLRRVFGKNPRYWFFTYPALEWPLPAARLYTRLTAAVSKGMYMAQLPGFWRKRS